MVRTWPASVTFTTSDMAASPLPSDGVILAQAIEQSEASGSRERRLTAIAASARRPADARTTLTGAGLHPQARRRLCAAGAGQCSGAAGDLRLRAKAAGRRQGAAVLVDPADPLEPGGVRTAPEGGRDL